VPIEISKSLIAKLPEAERADIEKALWEKSKGFCFLCDDPLHRASESIEADHDIPEAEGGETTLANLNLAHVECNRAKRNAKTVPIRPYLKLKAFTRKHGPRLKYDGLLAHFEILPEPSVVERIGDTVRFELPDGSTVTSTAHEETNPVGTFEYAFVELPRQAIYNDDVVQPRTVKDTHVWSIYADLQQNPLHEPPSCRIEKVGAEQKILMFDGQHKTIANWMMGRPTVVAKVYLNLSAQQATRLVNSIQSRIPKLPLSPFELAAKMDQEWRGKLDEYELHVGPDDVSEAGFFKWLPMIERPRARAAFREALVQTQLDNPDLRIRQFVRRAGEKAPADGLSINETTLKNKVLARLLNYEPLTLMGEDFANYRAIESENVAFLLNGLTDAALTPREGDAELTHGQVAAAKRMLYQSALSYLSDLLKKAFLRELMTDSLGAARPTDAQKARLDEQIHRLVDHPVWTAEYGRDENMGDVRSALEKNQEAKKTFEDVALDLSYLVVGADSAAFQRYWRDD
jgi:hypothetical protein